MDSYRVDVSDMLEVLGDTIVVSDEFPLDRLVVGAEEFTATQAPHFDVTLTNTGTAVIAMGRVVMPATATCARCLCDFPTVIDAEVDGFYVRPGDEQDVPEEQEFEYIDAEGVVDILPAITAALVLEAPFAPLHDEECAGLCAECGADLNEGPCGCEEAPAADNPFSALKSLMLEDEPADLGE